MMIVPGIGVAWAGAMCGVDRAEEVDGSGGPGGQYFGDGHGGGSSECAIECFLKASGRL